MAKYYCIKTTDFVLYICASIIANIIIIFFNATIAYSQPIKNDDQGTIIKKQPVLTPYQIISGDTLRMPDSLRTTTVLPGISKEEYLEMQDSNYARALRLNIVNEVRFSNDYIVFSKQREFLQDLQQGTPMDIIKKNMDIPRELYSPRGNEIVQRQIQIQNAFYVPFVNTYNPYAGIVSFGQIASLLGLTEDVSPRLSYALDYPSDVKIVIYSIQAIAIATLFDGFQSEGRYNLTWNLRDDQGRRLPHGDYIAEITIDNSRVIRKHIVIP